MNRRQLLVGGGAITLTGAGAAAVIVRQMGSMENYNASVVATRATLAQHPEMTELVRYATLAANGQNTQPWRFRIASTGIEIFPDLTRRTPVVDPDDHHLFASLGCAAENLAIVVGARGHPGRISYNAANGGSVAYTGGGPARH